MGNFEIFSVPFGLQTTMFAFLCLLLSAVYSVKEDRLFSPISFLMTAFVFDFISSWVESKAIVAYEQGEQIETYVMVELVLLLIAMILFLYRGRNSFNASACDCDTATIFSLFL